MMLGFSFFREEKANNPISPRHLLLLLSPNADKHSLKSIGINPGPVIPFVLTPRLPNSGM